MRKNRAESLQTPVASLIDVVFLLIIFFVVTASIETDVVDQEIELAFAENASQVEDVPPNRLIINIRKNGDMNIAKMQISRRRLRNLLSSQRNTVGVENLAILLRCDADTPYEHVSNVQDIITESGFYKVKLVAIAGS